MTAKEGTKVFLTAVVEGATEFTWQYLNPSIGQWTDMVDTNGVSGSKWSELSVVVSDIWSRYQFRLMASNESGKILSDTVTITDSLASYRNVGGYVTFGSYEQDDNTANGKEPIEWLVLDYDAAHNRALLLSRYGLETLPYNKEFTDITYEKSTLRNWLNGMFLNKAFTAQERAGIELTNVDNSSSQGYSSWRTSGGNNTQDKVFLLSYAEAKKYLGVTYNNSNNTKSRVAPTAYAIKQGAYTNNTHKTADGAAAGWWWLRSPGYDQKLAEVVPTAGSLSRSSVNADRGCVRPALWINLESDVFSTISTSAAASKPDLVGAKRSAFRNVGGYVTFGSYEQDNNEANGQEPIEWLVLDYDAANNRALLSRYGLDVQPYNTEHTNVTWEECTLRTWLNGAFLNKAFVEQEQAGILLTNVDNSDSQGYNGWNTSGGNNSQDKLFLLSYAEANKYLEENGKAKAATT